MGFTAGGEDHGIPLRISRIFRTLTVGGAGRGGCQRAQTHIGLHFLRTLPAAHGLRVLLITVKSSNLSKWLILRVPEYLSRGLLLAVGLHSLVSPIPQNRSQHEVLSRPRRRRLGQTGSLGGHPRHRNPSRRCSHHRARLLPGPAHLNRGPLRHQSRRDCLRGHSQRAH